MLLCFYSGIKTEKLNFYLIHHKSWVFGQEVSCKLYIVKTVQWLLVLAFNSVHRIIFPYLSDRLKRSRTFFILSPRVLKFCMKPLTHILSKIGGEQNLCQKVKYFSILNFVEKRVKNGKFWPKNGIPAFLAHKWR